MGAPYIGPRGGKYKDAAHKHAWTPEGELAATQATTSAAGALFSQALDALEARHTRAVKGGDKKAAAELKAQIDKAKAGQKTRKRFKDGKMVHEPAGAGHAVTGRQDWPHDVPGPSAAFWAHVEALEDHADKPDDTTKEAGQAVVAEARKVATKLRAGAQAAVLDRTRAVKLTSLAQQVEEWGKLGAHHAGGVFDRPNQTPVRRARKAPEGQGDLFSGPAPEKGRKARAPAQLGLFGKALEKAKQLDLFSRVMPRGDGWQSIPGGKKGGKRRRKGSGWEYWYPGVPGTGGQYDAATTERMRAQTEAIREKHPNMTPQQLAEMMRNVRVGHKINLETTKVDEGKVDAGEVEGRMMPAAARAAAYADTASQAHEWEPAAVSDVGERGGKPVMIFDVPKGYKAARTRWSVSGGSDGGSCDLCGQKIKNVYTLINRKRKLTMGVGSECIQKHTDIIQPQLAEVTRRLVTLRIKKTEVEPVRQLVQAGVDVGAAVSRVRKVNAAARRFDKKHPALSAEMSVQWDRQRARVHDLRGRRAAGEYLPRPDFDLLRYPKDGFPEYAKLGQPLDEAREAARMLYVRRAEAKEAAQSHPDVVRLGRIREALQAPVPEGKTRADLIPAHDLEWVHAEFDKLGRDEKLREFHDRYGYRRTESIGKEQIGLRARRILDAKIKALLPLAKNEEPPEPPGGWVV